MACGTSFVMILLIIFNIIFWLSGAALLAVGIWLLVDTSVIHYLGIFGAISSSSELFQYAAYVFIVVGGIVLIVGFFGCCGAIKKNRCMLGVYIVLLVVIMGLEIAAGVLAIIYKDQVLDKLDEKLQLAFNESLSTSTPSKKEKAFHDGLLFAQKSFECCGIDSSADYKNINKPYDVTCCVLKEGAKDKPMVNETDAKDHSACFIELDGPSGATTLNSYPIGCIDKLKEWITSKSIILIGIGIGIACLELFGFIFAVCLCRSIGDEE